MSKLSIFWEHLCAGLDPALKSLRLSAITVATTVVGFMASAPTAPLQSPQASQAYLEQHWWGILMGAFILPAVRGLQGTSASIANGKTNSQPPGGTP